MSEEKITSQFNDVMNEIEKNSEEYWNSLSKEHQLAAFCAVSRRIYQAEIYNREFNEGDDLGYLWDSLVDTYNLYSLVDESA